MSDSDSKLVLAVDDEANVVEAYSLYLRGEYTVRTANSGEEALEKLDESVDVVLLDRRMPNLTGDKVLERIRQEDYATRVAMVTAVTPDFDMLEMEFDDYLSKPVSKQEVRETVDKLATINTYESIIQEQFALIQKRDSLEAEKTKPELEQSDEYAELLDRLDKIESQIDKQTSEMDSDEFDTMFQQF